MTPGVQTSISQPAAAIPAAAAQMGAVQAAPAAAAARPAQPGEEKKDYSQQWIEYYRAQGMHKEADMVEQQLKAQKAQVS